MHLLLVLSLLLVASSVLAAAQRDVTAEQQDPCQVFQLKIDETKQRLGGTQEQVAQFRALLAGHINEVSKPESLFTYVLDDVLQVDAEIARLKREKAALTAESQAAQTVNQCEHLEKQWQRLNQENRQATLDLIALKQSVLEKTQASREFLQQQLQLLGKLSEIRQQLPEPLEDHAKRADFEIEQDHKIVQLHELIRLFQIRLHQWWQLSIDQSVSFRQVNSLWLEVMAFDTQTLATMASSKKQIPEPGLALVEAVSHELLALNSQLTLGLTAWRNQALMDAEWLMLARQLYEPEIFLRSFFYELTWAPALLWHRLSQPFKMEYQLAVQREETVGVLSSWALQLICLLLLLNSLFRSAAHATSWLAGVQQRMLGKLETHKGHSILSGFFWMVKPNASWIFILLVAQASQLLFADDWYILNLLAPIATLYAAFRALRIIIEWGFSRTYTRSGLFLSNHTSEQLVVDSQRMTWIILYLAISWGLAYATGGGYLLYIVSLLDLFLFFAVLWWLLYKHATAVNKLTHQVLGLKLDVAAGERSWILRMLSKLAWPLIFFLVQLLDILFSLNQKLMVFDVYRSFSVKLLRVRLDSRAEESDEEEEGAEPDQNYSDWMLRDAPDNLLFDVGEVAGLLTPIKHWYSDKTDENVMVVIGESGSGKSTLIRRLPALWTDSPVQVLDVQAKTIEPQVLFDQVADTLGIERFTDIAGLVRQDSQLEPQVLVIDSAHNLFLAEVGHLKAYKALLECMNSHMDNVFWLVVMHAPSWTYLNCVFSREQRISNVFKMPRWSPMDIRKLILSRHQGGRRRLKYNEMLLSAAASSESSSVRAADSRVFNILWEQCGGNPLAAIELWLNAVKVKGRIAEVGVPQRPASNLLNGLKDDLFFVYTAIVAHSELSTAEIMLVTHFSEPVVRHALKQGINLGMITRDGAKRYKVDPYWYGTLSGFLHRKNMLWD